MPPFPIATPGKYWTTIIIIIINANCKTQTRPTLSSSHGSVAKKNKKTWTFFLALSLSFFLRPFSQSSTKFELWNCERLWEMVKRRSRMGVLVFFTGGHGNLLDFDDGSDLCSGIFVITDDWCLLLSLAISEHQWSDTFRRIAIVVNTVERPIGSGVL